MKCECGKELIKQEMKINQKIAKSSKTKNMGLCQECWSAFCHHAITGE